MKGSIGTSCGMICTRKTKKIFYRQVKDANKRHEKDARLPFALSKSTMPAQIVVIAPREESK